MGREQRGAEPPKRVARFADDQAAQRRLRAAQLAGVTLAEFDGQTPTETHTHRDTAGNVTGTTVVTRDSLFDSRLRAVYLTAVEYQDRCCPRCGNFDTRIEIRAGRRTVTFYDSTGLHVEREIDVHQYRCLTCAASEFVERRFTDLHSKTKPSDVEVAPGDGQRFVAVPLDNG